MKIKSILAVGALGLGLAGLANAATTNFVYITGSTAFRPGIFNTLTNSVFDSMPTWSATKCSTVGPLNPQTASYMNFIGTIGGQYYVIKCSWSGSEAGISDLNAGAGAGKEPFLDTGTAPGATTSNPTPTDSHTVDLAMADNDQSVSLFPNGTLNGVQVGIVPFLWIKNAQTNSSSPTAPADWARLNNVTDPELRVALNGGSPLALFTGNSTDTNYVYVSGRDNQSGTYVNTMLDTQFGLALSPKQIEITAVGGVATITPTNLITGFGKNVGGQNSGGTLATSMTIIGSSTSLDTVYLKAAHKTHYGWYAIAYVGLYDADVALGEQGPVALPGGVAVPLTYNGVPESAANIENGTYSFWGNEWIYESQSNLSTGGITVYNALIGSVNGGTGAGIPGNLDGDHQISLTAMLASKSNSGSDATHN